MPITKNIYRYHFKLGNKIVCTGVTHDLYRSVIEHRREPGWGKGHIVKVGLPVDYDDALAWMAEQKKKGKPVLTNFCAEE